MRRVEVERCFAFERFARHHSTLTAGDRFHRVPLRLALQRHLELELTLVHIRSEFQALDVRWGHLLKPDGLPYPAASTIKRILGSCGLLAKGIIASLTGIVDLD